MTRQNLDRVCVAQLRRNATLSTTLVMLLLAAFAAGARAASGETIDSTFPASITAAGEYANQDTGESPSISADGRYVAFASDATNLGEHGPAGVYEAYVKDLDTGEVKLVSRVTGADGEPANEPGEASGVENVIISGDGQYVIFTSSANNLVTGLPTPGPEEYPRHVYRRDLQTGETLLVDRVTGSEGAILDERSPEAEAISEEGRYVLFRDHVEDLENPAGEHEPGLSTVYVRDIQTGTTTTVSRAGGSSIGGPEGELANENSRGNSISPDGRYAAFTSAATNLVAGMEANTASQVYVRDLQSNTTTLISKTAAGEPGNEFSDDPILVGVEGCEVAFQSAATNLYRYEGNPVSSPQVYLTDLCSTPASTTLVSRADGENGTPAGVGNAATPTPLGASADGRYILFTAFSELTGEVSPSTSEHLYLRDLETGQTTLVDRASGADGALAFSNPDGGSISANGCRVAFVTASPNLTEPAPPLSGPLETYIRQLAPCEPPAAEEQHKETKETSGGETGKGKTLGGEQPSAGASQTGASGATTTAPSIECVVPFMRALDLQAVERALSVAHCELGQVAHHYNTIPKGGLVEQSLHQGTIRPAGTRVDVWLSKGHDYLRRKVRRER
jgi:Tol biopolymer transport system component